MQKTDRKVVVTGLGIISSAGFNAEEFFSNLCAGVDMTGPITTADTKGFRRLIAAEIKDELPSTEKWRKYSRASQMALLAARDALDDANLKPGFGKIKPALSLATMGGGAPEIEDWYLRAAGKQFGKEQIDLLKQFSLHSVASTLAHEFKVNGPINTVMSACASGTIAIGIAYKWIKRGRADLVICGGVDAFRVMTHLEVSTLRIVSPEKVAPFDAKRKGILIGEGAGILILESETNAKQRGARIYCNVLGYGASCDAYDLAHPEENGIGISAAINNAIADAKIDRRTVNYINAHGTGTMKNDSAETSGIKRVFGDYARSLYLSSIKGAIGHTLGAAGAIEAVATVMTIHQGRIPPTINYQNYDPNCDLNVVPNKCLEVKVETAMSNSFGFGGNNAVIVFGVNKNG